MDVTPRSRATSKDGSVFSGFRPRAPRWPCRLNHVDMAEKRNKKTSLNSREVTQRGRNREEAVRRWEMRAISHRTSLTLSGRLRLVKQFFWPGRNSAPSDRAWFNAKQC